MRKENRDCVTTVGMLSIDRIFIISTVIGIVTDYALDDRGVGVRVPVETRILSTSSRPPLSPGRKCDHTPSTAEVKKMLIYTPTPPYAFMAYSA
jgi:hypothetical protein